MLPAEFRPRRLAKPPSNTKSGALSLIAGEVVGKTGMFTFFLRHQQQFVYGHWPSCCRISKYAILQ